MSTDELAEANRRIAGDDSVPVVAANPVSHVVAGHLARRSGVSLRLEGSPGWGIMATIELPSAHLTAIPPAPRPGTRSEAGPALLSTVTRPHAGPGIPGSPSSARQSIRR
jgi:hypothetical protein